MARGQLDVSVVSAIEYARASERYVLLPDLAISCDGPVRRVLLLSKVPAPELGGKRVMLSRSSMTSVALLELLFENVWHAKPEFAPGDAELTDIARFADEVTMRVWSSATPHFSSAPSARHPTPRIRSFTTSARSGSAGRGCLLCLRFGWRNAVPRWIAPSRCMQR
jgi:hypothetical protein